MATRPPTEHRVLDPASRGDVYGEQQSSSAQEPEYATAPLEFRSPADPSLQQDALEARSVATQCWWRVA